MSDKKAAHNDTVLQRVLKLSNGPNANKKLGLFEHDSSMVIVSGHVIIVMGPLIQSMNCNNLANLWKKVNKIIENSILKSIFGLKNYPNILDVLFINICISF